MDNQTSTLPRSEISSRESMVFTWILLRNQLKNFEEWSTEKRQDDPVAATGKHDYVVHLCELLSTLSLGNLHEPESLFIEPAHLFNEEETETIFAELMEDIPVDSLKKLGLSLIDLSLVCRYPTSQAMEIGGFSTVTNVSQLAQRTNKKNVAVVDPLYGMAMLKLDGGWKTMGFAEHVWMTRALRAPEHQRLPLMKRAMEHLSEGVSIANLFFSQILPAYAREQMKRFEVPEVVVQSPVELAKFLNALHECLHASQSGYQLWLRGQPYDYLTPDRAELVEKRIAGYCSVRDSSLVPGLYRSIDKYLGDPDNFMRLSKHLADWTTATNLLIPDLTTILDETGKNPYTPKPMPKNATSTFTCFFAGKPHLDIPSLKDLGPYNLWEIRDTEGNVVDRYIKLFHPSLQMHNTNLLLQHYGCPTAWLDITKDIQVALWFALNKMESQGVGAYVSTRYKWTSANPAGWPTLYVFALHPEMQPFVDTSEILAGSKFLRPQVQKCGLLGAAGNLCRNYAARFIAIKIRLSPAFEGYSTIPANQVFPDEADEGLKELLAHQHKMFDEKLFPVYRVNS